MHASTLFFIIKSLTAVQKILQFAQHDGRLVKVKKGTNGVLSQGKVNIPPQE